MSLCVCGHPGSYHAQFDDGEYCQECKGSCPGYRKAADSIESTAILSAGGSPEGLARETVAESVNRPAVRQGRMAGGECRFCHSISVHLDGCPALQLDPRLCPHGNGLSCMECQYEAEAEDATWD